MSAHEERREQEGDVEAQGGHESEVKAQEGHESEVKAQGEQEDDENSLHEESHVSKRHMTWWQNAWWVRVNNGPHLLTARDRRRVWRAATRAAGSARDGKGRRGRKGEMGETGESGEEEKTTRCTSYSTSLPTQPHQPNRRSSNSRSNSSNSFSQPLHPGTGALLHNKRVIAVPGEPTLHLELYLRDVTEGARPVLEVSCCRGLNLLLGWVSIHLPFRMSTTMHCSWPC